MFGAPQKKPREGGPRGAEPCGLSEFGDGARMIGRERVMAPIALPLEHWAGREMHAGTEDLERASFGNGITEAHQRAARLFESGLNDKDEPAIDEFHRELFDELSHLIFVLPFIAELVEREPNQDEVKALSLRDGAEAPLREIHRLDAHLGWRCEAFDWAAEEGAGLLKGGGILIDRHDLHRPRIAL